MSATVFTGPVITCRDNPLQELGTPVGVSANQNPDNGPSMFNMATALLDPRYQYTYVSGQAQSPIGFNSAGVAINTAPPTVGWLSATFQVADYAPGTASTASLAASQVFASSAVVLTTSAASGVTPASTMTNASSGATVTGLWLIDSAPGFVTWGTGTYGVWDPTNPPIGRCVSISGSTTSMAAVTFTLSGYDAYGYPITQVMQGPGGNATVYSTKAFKWLSGITAAGTASTTTFSVGVSDIYGLPFYASAVGYINAYWGNSQVASFATASTFTAGSAVTATTSSDVRGTLDLRWAASSGTRKLQMWQSVAPANLTAGAIFGTTPA